VKGAGWIASCAFVLGLAMGSCVQAPQTPEWQVAQAKRNDITALWTQIRDWRRDARMDVEPTPASVVAMRPFSVGDARRVCPDGHRPPSACDDVCDLSDAICGNADSICGIASELGEDPWAKDKCDSAKASCKEAKQRCCECEAHAAEAP
jgi:hypothetical protein